LRRPLAAALEKKDHIFMKMSSPVNKKTTTRWVVKFTQRKILCVF